MGHTHNWELKKVVEASKWGKFLVGAHQIIDAAVGKGIPIKDDSSGEFICINGVDDDAYEDFEINSDNVEWSCCNTDSKPYDIVVTAILILLKEIVGNDVKIESDGDWDNERRDCGMEFYKTVFG